MSEPIISRAQLRAMGARAFAAKVNRADHPFNPGAAAIADWLQGWDDAAKLARIERQREAAIA